jgi:hypothetical protein
MESENVRVTTVRYARKGATLVLGGRGKTGRRVAERLKGRGVPVRVGSRSAKPPFDWEDETTWAPALEGMGAVYASYHPDVAMPGAVAAGRDIRFVPLSLEEFESALAEEDVPPEFVSFLIYIFGEVLDGRNAYLTYGVRRALGRDPRDFADYAREAAPTGVWDGKR